MSKTSKEQSPLVKSVLALDEHLFELERVGAKINEMPMKSEFDLEQIRRLMARFAEYGQGVTKEVTNLSTHLNEARARAEQVATGVAQRAAQLDAMNSNQQEKWDQLRALNEKVRDLNSAIAGLRRPEGEELSNDDRQQLALQLKSFDTQLDPLIEEAQSLRQDAHSANMKSLEQNADSLAQTLLSVRQKIRVINPTQLTH